MHPALINMLLQMVVLYSKNVAQVNLSGIYAGAGANKLQIAKKMQELL